MDQDKLVWEQQKQDRERERLQKQIAQGETVASLISNPGWIFFRGWIEETMKKAERRSLNKEFRTPGLQHEIVRSMDAIDLYRELIEAPERFVKSGFEARKTIEALDGK